MEFLNQPRSSSAFRSSLSFMFPFKFFGDHQKKEESLNKKVKDHLQGLSPKKKTKNQPQPRKTS